MNIGKAAEQAGLTVKTVRYYSDIGMVVPYQDPKTGYRDFSLEEVAKLQFIGKARRFDFSIEECRELLSLYQDKDRPSKEVKKLTLEKISKIEKNCQNCRVCGTNCSIWLAVVKEMTGQIALY